MSSKETCLTALSREINFSWHPQKSTYGIVNDRIYYAHFPRKITAGINVIKKELKLQVSRPEYDNPSKMIMHSVTYVRIRSNTVDGKYDKLAATCPKCPASAVAVVSKGKACRDCGWEY